MSLVSSGHKIEVPRVYKTLDLEEYAEGLPTIRVWVNPPRRMIQEFNDLRGSWMSGLRSRIKRPDSIIHRILYWIKDRFILPETENKLVAWYGRLWGGDEGYSDEQVLSFANELVEVDPSLLTFMMSSTWQLIEEHRESAKKN